ncbi:hypothetical protein [Streptomyces sp. NPDC085596]|uniref:hypothetical protein n=1 Tax=Streptomyces sp. NPDC085596 TaxID=3365731 RepID=UPI0037CF0C46
MTRARLGGDVNTAEPAPPTLRLETTVTQTDDLPEPIRKSSLPCTPPPEWEFHTWFPHPDGGGDMVPGERQRGILVRRRVTYGDWEPVRPDYWADEPEPDAAAASVVVSPPPGHAADDELTAEEARDLAADLGLQLYRAQDALAFVGECCAIADREGRAVTTADVREWLKGARCGRQRAAEAPQPDTEAHEPLHRWRIELLDGDHWKPESSPFTGLPNAVLRYAFRSQRTPTWPDGTPMQRRIVRETTTYTVEQASAVSQPAADGGEETPITVTVHSTRCWPCMTDDCPHGPHQVDDMPDVACGCGCVSEETR